MSKLKTQFNDLVDASSKAEKSQVDQIQTIVNNIGLMKRVYTFPTNFLSTATKTAKNRYGTNYWEFKKTVNSVDYIYESSIENPTKFILASATSFAVPLYVSVVDNNLKPYMPTSVAIAYKLSSALITSGQYVLSTSNNAQTVAPNSSPSYFKNTASITIPYGNQGPYTPTQTEVETFDFSIYYFS